MPDHPSYHGFIAVAPTLELENPIGVRWVALGVFADRPFPRLCVHLLALLSSCAGSRARRWGDVLAGELTTATPERGVKRSVRQRFPLPPTREYKLACRDELGPTRVTRASQSSASSGTEAIATVHSFPKRQHITTYLYTHLDGCSFLLLS